MEQQLEEIELQSDGAHFMLADLHIHTIHASPDVVDEKMTVENVVDAASAKGLSIISITDHHSTSNLRRAIEYAATNAPQLLVVPGMEISTGHGHLLVYTQHVNDLDELLVHLKIVGRLDKAVGHTSMSMTDAIRLAQERGAICVAAHIDRDKVGFERLASGYPNWKHDVLTSSGLSGLEFDDSENLAWYSVDDTSTEAAERAKLLKAREESCARPFLAHIQSSDAHSLEQFRQTSDLTLLKCEDLSWNAFKTAFLDPDARIKALFPLPEFYPKIVGLAISGGFADRQRFHFSANLNCIFGGRGAGKTTALLALVHVIGVDDTMEGRSDCPAALVALVEDSSGRRWVFQKTRGQPRSVLPFDGGDGTYSNDSFPVEYYRQNELTGVSEGLTTDGFRLQAFLDRHIQISHLVERERTFRRSLQESAAVLLPLEANAATLPALQAEAEQIDKQIRAAEEGKLAAVAAFKSQLENERQLLTTVRSHIEELRRKTRLESFRADFATLEKHNQPLLALKTAAAEITSISSSFATFDDSVSEARANLGKAVQVLANAFSDAKKRLDLVHQDLEQRISARIKTLQQQGLKGDIRDLEAKVRRRADLGGRVSTLQSSRPDLEQARSRRAQLKADLEAVRNEIMQKRRKQLDPINRNLRRTIDDFLVIFDYDASGDAREFFSLFSNLMTGSEMRDEQMRRLCLGTTPQQLALLVAQNNQEALQEVLRSSDIATGWSEKILRTFGKLENLFQLETAWKPSIPRITIRTRGSRSEYLPVEHLSLGQKHTILLTVAMLSDSYLPLIIDQPEDDLDNAFIYKTVVSVLREVKQRRQVIVVTHNANIAVLGDSELLLPMRRDGENGVVFDRGSIDSTVTRGAVMQILEGGKAAFQRRAEMYHIQ